MTRNDVHATLGEAVRQHQAGQIDKAALLYRQVLTTEPDNADALHLLGMVALQQGRPDEAAEWIAKAIARHDRNASYHFHHALALQTLDDLDGAVAGYGRALALNPNDPNIYNNMGNALAAQHQLEDASAAFLRLLALQPDNAVALNNLGTVQRLMGARDEAEASFRKAIALQPSLTAALVNLGNIQRDKGALRAAEASYRQAVTLDPGNGEGLANLAITCRESGKDSEAMALVCRALAIRETPDDRKLFAELARRLGSADEAIRPFMARAITEVWDRPSLLAPAAARLIRAHHGALVARADAAWPAQLSLADLLGDASFAPLAQDTLLLALLNAAPNTDIALERFLTLLRGAMLRELAQAPCVDPHAHIFAAALAQQCFINEYVFVADDTELAAASALLETPEALTPMQLLLAAAWLPLHRLANAEEFSARNWHAPLDGVITQQIREPLQEERLRAGLPRLTRIEHPVSQRVQQQYEENPYPRWVRSGPETQDSIVNFMAAKFSQAGFAPPARPMQDILIAGCGTGQRPITLARKFGDQHMLAIDLSLASLGYAQRKSKEMGLKIVYGQADILELDALERQFDLIESLGVLHHLENPFSGWRMLLSLLRPGGVMLLGLYSASARRPVAEARCRIAARGLGGSAADIRVFRQELMKGGDASILGSEDFFSLSACRDLLFHVQEHHLTLAQIAQFTCENGLRMLGFELDAVVLAAYRQRFAQDSAATDLACWAAFEAEHPGLFGGMYTFWIQKPA